MVAGCKPKATTATTEWDGNVIGRTVGGVVYTLTYDAENRLQQVKQGSTVVSSYTYDADGARVKAVIGSDTTVYVGAIYEQTTSGSSTTITKYYQAGGQRIALRVNGVVRWLATDHLGSTALTVNESGGRMSEIRYKPWGESRYTFGATPTQRRFTGQVLDNVAGGLYFYNARYYDPSLGRFASADTLIPNAGNPQNLNRYSYALNNSVRFSDPSGHYECEGAVNCNGPDPALPAAPLPAPAPASAPTPSPICTPFVTPQYQGPVYRAAPNYAPDDGWILKFRIHGDADLRLEYVHVFSYATRGTLPAAVAGEYRTVYIFDDGATRVFDEPALSFTVGEGLYAGNEWTPTGGRQTTVGVGFGGVDIQLQQNQIMAGIVNPAGVGGGRIGAGFSASGVRVLATSQAYLVEMGGGHTLGQHYFGRSTSLEWSMWIPGGYAANGAWVSGAQWAAAWANQWPIKVVP